MILPSGNLTNEPKRMQNGICMTGGNLMCATCEYWEMNPLPSYGKGKCTEDSSTTNYHEACNWGIFK